jgi:Flp pilus assembly protein TadD
MATGKMTPAIRESDLAVELDPLSTTTWAQLAACKLRVGLFDEAEKDLRRVLEIQPGRPFSLWLFGHAHVLEGRFDEGLAEIRRALALSKENSMILAGLGWALAGHPCGRRPADQPALVITGFTPGTF